jgi:Flp pilus assembly pilin Flp
VRLRHWIRSIRSERGTSLAEYALILSGVSLGMVAAVAGFSGTIEGMWNGVVSLM